MSELKVDGEVIRMGNAVSESEGTLVTLYSGSIHDRRRKDLPKLCSKCSKEGVEQVIVEGSGGSHPSAVIEENHKAVEVQLYAVATIEDTRALQHD